MLRIPALPTGTITFLFTDIEGSTRLWERAPEAMSPALARHEQILREAVTAHHGHVFKTMGDAFCVAFPTAPEALKAAVAAQSALAAESWTAFSPNFESLRVRMALHTGAAEERDGDYFGPALNRAARLMAAGHGGQVLLSLATQELVRDDLSAGVMLRDMGDRRLKDLRRPEHVFQLLAVGLPSDFPPLSTLDARPNNLPIQLSSFVGREREMVDVKRLLTTSRLVTLTGVGGTGKTRLALQVAADVIDDYDHGVWFVDLAPIHDSALVAQTLAGALGVRESPGRAIEETLAELLRSQRLLVVLDNCEHVIESCAALADRLLHASPGLRIVATSREALAIGGEFVWPVPPLQAPDPARLVSSTDIAEQLSQYDAVRLFIDRSVAVRPEFSVTNANAPAVAEVCHRLDGIPLAIELAAARVKVLSPEQIAERLDERFRLLTGGSRTALPRQQTLRAAIDWSYDLLDRGEQVLFGRLAVFRGGWTLKAAEAVCGGNGVGEVEVLDQLSRLVDKSLVVAAVEGGGSARYRCLESVRQFAREKLAASGDERRLTAAHLGYFVDLTELAEPDLVGSDQAGAMDLLEAEHDNLRAAVDEAVAGALAGPGLLFGRVLWRFWWTRGYWVEGVARLGAILSLPGGDATSRATCLNALGALERDGGETELALTHHNEALALFSQLDDSRGMAAALNNLGILAREKGDYAEARALFERSLAIFRGLDDPWRTANALLNLGNLAFSQGDYPDARVKYGEALESFRVCDNDLGAANVLSNLGLVAVEQGDFAEARSLHERGLAIRRACDDTVGTAVSLGNLGELFASQGDYMAARPLIEEAIGLHRAQGYRLALSACLRELGCVMEGLADLEAAGTLHDESLTISREIGDRRGAGRALLGLSRVALGRSDWALAASQLAQSAALSRELDDKQAMMECLECLGWLEARRGRAEPATVALGSAAAIKQRLGIAKFTHADELQHAATAAACRAALGEAAFEAAWSLGTTLSLDEALPLVSGNETD